MRPVPFIAASAEEAVSQIRARLGPEAVVLNVRPLPANGLARLWQKPLIEVLAYLPEPKTNDAQPIAEALLEFQEQLNEIKQHVKNSASPPSRKIGEIEDESFPGENPSLKTEYANGDWRAGIILQKTGVLPLHTQTILDQLRAEHGETPPPNLEREMDWTRALLAKSWRRSSEIECRSIHVFVGPAGSGKTTSLAKWLTRAALVEGHLARVWRLDGATANMAESLSVYCEILGVPIERSWQTAGILAEDIGFIDLPGVDWRNPAAIRELGKQLEPFSSPKIHLTLNGAYDISILLAQVRAFSVLPIEDLILTHLDEESRWGKIWNLALGTKYSIRHFSTGQNIPGDFFDASAEMIFTHQFPKK
jgi:flagellar biosynthesis protein FlhF